MTETSKYLAVLAKVMRNKSLQQERQDKEKIDKLYNSIYTELFSALRDSMYPYTSDIIRRTKDMIDAIEPLYLCPEVVGKCCLMISAHYTTSVFKICRKLIEDKETNSVFERISTQIPFIISDTDGATTVEVINFADIRISLSVNELKFLIIQSRQRKIALNKIIRLVIIKTKLVDPKLCIIAENLFSDADKMFKRAVSERLEYVDKDDVTSLKGRNLDKNSVLLMSDEVYKSTRDDPAVRKYNTVVCGDLEKYTEEKVCPVLYGFKEEFIAVRTQIKEYYDLQLLQSRKTVKGVKGDLVRLEEGETEKLRPLLDDEINKKEKLEKERSKINSALGNIDELIDGICSDLRETEAEGKRIPRKVIDDLFISFFRCKNFDDDLVKLLLGKLSTYNYDDLGDLVRAYISSRTSKLTDEYPAKKIEPWEWEKAKMLISILDIDDIPEGTLKKYYAAIKQRCDTGKELYVQALFAKDSDKQEILQKSLSKGYKKAGEKLIEMYNAGDTAIDLKKLASALIPEACMILADQTKPRDSYTQKLARWRNNEFTYYKIAAANDHLPAIGKIVDLIYNSEIIGVLKKQEFSFDKVIMKVTLGCRTIRELCTYLIKCGYQTERYTEIKGIVLFLLAEEYSESMRLLEKSKSALASFCIGYMYENGLGVSADIDKAISYYELSMKKEPLPGTQSRLNECMEKKAVGLKLFGKTYNEDKDYSSRTTYTGSSSYSDGCFAPHTRILRADGTFCEVDELKADEPVWAFDHYSGKLVRERIIANVHEISGTKDFDIIRLEFGDGKKLEIVKSHALFDVTENQYVWLDSDNVGQYVGHSFAVLADARIGTDKLTAYSVEHKNTMYYMPITRYHLNIFAEGLLTMPPAKIIVNMFSFGDDMRYDLSPVEKYGLTPYSEIEQFVSPREYEDLPCKYLKAVCALKNASLEDFEYAMGLFREQYCYQ